MKLFQQILASILLTFLYTFSLVMGMATVQVVPGELIVTQGEIIEFAVHVPDNSIRDQAEFQWFIDGKELPGMQTSSLSLSWGEYLAFFPEDENDDATRFVSVAVTGREGDTQIDEAMLRVIHTQEIEYEKTLLPVCIDIELSCVL